MTSELIIDQSEKLFIIEDEEDTIQFKIKNNPLNDKASDTTSSSRVKNLMLVSQSNIKIRNISKEFISFRVKTTKTINYIVKPCYYVLSPNEILNLKIYFYLKIGENINSKGHKFKFEGFTIPVEEKNKEAKKLFNEYITKGKKVKGTVIKKYASFIEERNLLNSEIEDDIYLNNYDEDKKLDEFEDLKIEYCKLKGINENLRMEYFNIKKMMEMELKEKNKKCVRFMQFQYDVDVNNIEQPLSKKIFIISFIVSIIIGFFLIK